MRPATNWGELVMSNEKLIQEVVDTLLGLESEWFREAREKIESHQVACIKNGQHFCSISFVLFN